MGSTTPTSSDRSRTYWTPMMEQFFICLLKDHMHRGNQSGHTFNKQAWTDMITVFNAKFRSQYDKDVLKSCYTTLWKQFNDIKNLLDQSGFSWNDTQQMVVADDYVWDAYIKAHPEAQAYRNIAVMNFNDLRFIYAYTTADGRYSRSSHDVDFDDDFHGMSFGDEMGSLALASNGHSNTDWTPTMDQYFMELMLRQVKKGNKINNTFKRQTWTDMVAVFNAQFCSQHGKRDLIHRYKKLQKYYGDIRLLLEDGFSWDEKRQMLVADDDVWDNYIRAHPHAQAYRKKTLLNYQHLDLIYGSPISDGVCGYLNQDEDFEDEILELNGEGEDTRCHAKNDLSETDWTPLMDRYLIDLMLVQVHKWSKIDHKSSKQVWVDMVTLFNETFGAEHDKNILSCRCESLRRLYNELKNLLEQSGFFWDDIMQKVTAYDNVWDAYVEVHPEAKSFRTEKKPNFNDLSLIYGSSDVGFNQSDHNENFHGGGSNLQEPNGCGVSMTDWTPPMDRYLIDLMLEEVRKGGLVDHKLNEQAWSDMVVKFKSQFGPPHDRDVLRSGFKNLKRCFDDMKILVDQSGFTWDEMLQMITAADDLWAAYIKENPDAAAYRSRTLPNYNDLFLIYGNISINEDDSGSRINVDNHDLGVRFGEDDNDSPASSSTSKACADAEMKMNSSSPEFGMDGSLRDTQFLARDIGTTIHRKRCCYANPSNLSSSRKVQRTAYSTDEEDDVNYGSIESIVDALQTIPDMNDELFLDACKLLEDESEAKMFVALDVMQRKMWLLGKLHW